MPHHPQTPHWDLGPLGTKIWAGRLGGAISRLRDHFEHALRARRLQLVRFHVRLELARSDDGGAAVVVARAAKIEELAHRGFTLEALLKFYKDDLPKVLARITVFCYPPRCGFRLLSSNGLGNFFKWD